MYSDIEVIETTVFATLPAEFDHSERDSHMSRDMFRGRPLPSFLEGPSFDRNGDLYVVDIAHGRIFAISPAGEFALVADYDGSPNGLKIHQDGRIFVADRQNGILEIDPVNGKVTPYIGADKLPGYKGVNDLFFDSKGNLYFTDQGSTGLHDPTGRVFCQTVGGELHCLIDNVPSPNGLVMDPDETMLYLAVTRANAVWRLPFRRDGTVNRVGLFAQLVGGLGPDGLAVDRDGNLAIAHPGRGVVWLINPMGLPSHRIDVGDGAFGTNIAYGGPGNRSLFITNSHENNILRAELPVPGETMYALMD